MILFKEDWDKFPSAIVDVKTKNESFIRMSALLRKMGVKNHEFILQLHNRDLQGVDPYDPNLTHEQMTQIAVECKQNFWYFIREIARDPAAPDDRPVMLRLNRGLLAAYWLFFNHILVLLIMIRQTGKSFGLSWLSTYLANIGLTRSDISVMTLSDKTRGREVQRLKAMELALPPYLKQRGKFDPGNTEVMRISSLENNINFYLPNKSAKLADAIGRGMTAPVVIIDEYAYCWNNFISVPVMLTTTNAIRELSRHKNEPYGTIFATTSGKRDTPEGRYAFRVMSEAAVWSESSLDAKNLEVLEDMVRKMSPGKRLHVNVTMNHQQLGYDDKWLAARLEEAMAEDPVQIRADFFNEWPSGTTSSPFSQETARAMRESEKSDFYGEICRPEPFVFRWFIPDHQIKIHMRRPHILSIDPSDAIERDAIGIILRDVETGGVTAACDVSSVNLIMFAQWVKNFLVEYTNVVCIVERRSSGPMIIDYLIHYLIAEGHDPFRRLYNKVVQEAEEYPERFQSLKKMTKIDAANMYKKHFGWATSGSGATSRSELYSTTLNLAAKYTAHSMHDRTLILQTLSLENRNGRLDHASGQNDDLTLAWLLSYWLLSLGKNLSYYGIDPASIMSKNEIHLKSFRAESQYEEQQREEARQIVEELVERIRQERDEYIARRLEYDLEHAIQRLGDQDRAIIAADDLITQLRDQRKRNMNRFRVY